MIYRIVMYVLLIAGLAGPCWGEMVIECDGDANCTCTGENCPSPEMLDQVIKRKPMFPKAEQPIPPTNTEEAPPADIVRSECWNVDQGSCRVIPEKSLNGQPMRYAGGTTCSWVLRCCTVKGLSEPVCGERRPWNSWDE